MSDNTNNAKPKESIYHQMMDEHGFIPILSDRQMQTIRIIKQAHSVEQVESWNYPNLHEASQRAAAIEGIPEVHTYVYDDGKNSMNAFLFQNGAIGVNKHTATCYNVDELEGILLHEMQHGAQLEYKENYPKLEKSIGTEQEKQGTMGAIGGLAAVAAATFAFMKDDIGITPDTIANTAEQGINIIQSASEALQEYGVIGALTVTAATLLSGIARSTSLTTTYKTQLKEMKYAIEFDSDRHAVENSSNPSAYINAFKEIAQHNPEVAATPGDAHPSMNERISYAEKILQERIERENNPSGMKSV